MVPPENKGNNFEKELGVTAPLNYWDPLGLAKDGDKYDFDRRRRAEIKNGRVAMLAVMGWIAPEAGPRFPGYLSPTANLKFADIPNGMAALKVVPAVGWAQIAVFVGFLELFPMWQDKNRAAGDFESFGKFGVPFFGSKSDPAKNAKSLNAELNNGRLAMLAITGMVVQSGLVGSTGPEMWGPHAFESELGVQAPFGFWDPLGFTADGDADNFRRRRGVELKHGRISMLATIGYIVPEYFKWGGEISPSQSLKFADIPNGIGAISKVPIEGWLQIGLFAGHMEGKFFRQDALRAPGDFEDIGFLGIGRNFIFNFEPAEIKDPATRNKKLNTELANGRLAMVAIMAMLFQNGTVGSTASMWLPASAFETELGVQAPLGYWDPLKMSADGDVETFRRRRESEIKNGRVAMLAAMGYIAAESHRFPGFLSITKQLKFEDVPNGVAALTKVPAEGWFQWFALCGFYETAVNIPVNPAEPGNYGKGRLGITGSSITDPEARKRSLNSEIANGRLAMLAIMGMILQNGVTGTTGPAMWIPGGAFESELGVQAPIGFWDPAGFTNGADAGSFRRRRAIELKHGRVAMLATLGYIVPEFYRFPGDLSPSLGLKFADVPAGLAAFSKVPLSGWAQMFVFVGHAELFILPDDGSRAPGDFAYTGVFGIPKGPDAGPRKADRLASELANGRLAMVAIIGMFFQDGLTGSAWGDWSLYTESPLR